jgi:CheY-like chemotaxis protein/anti-sigma regulatory factor (Ser/Thr protein kinase)
VTGDALALLTPTLPATVDLVTEVAPDCPAVAVDATEWHQLIMNLATNAVQALPAAKGRVEVRVEPASLDSDAGALPAVRLGVRDDGCGMPPDVVARCRDPYFTTKPAGVGTGMGLAICHGIVGSLGGQLEIASQPEVGTTVQVTLPAAPPPPAANGADAAAPADTGADAPAPGRAPADRPATVMVVEDEEAIRRLVATALQRREFDVRTFGDPHEALAAFCDAPEAVDVVISDQTMPGMTGAELSRELLAIRADLPVIVCSGHSETFGEEQARALGIRAYLPKPVPLDDLLATVRRELGERAGT